MVAGCCWDVAVVPADVDGCWDVAVETLASCLPRTFACYPIGARLSQLVGIPGWGKPPAWGDSTFGFSRPGILSGVQSVRVVVTPAVDKEEGRPMDTSQRTESRVDQWSPMVIRYNAIRLTSQQVDPAGGSRLRGCGWPLAVAGMRQ